MVHSIAHVVRQFKNNWSNELDEEAVEKACRDHDMTWNDSLLNPIMTIKIFFLQILHGNTAMTHLRHLTKLCFTASAYCQARMKIPLAVFQTLLARTAARLHEDLSDAQRWLGHRLFVVDGSSFSMPDKP